MRIAFLVPSLYDLGGTAGAVAVQASALAAADHEVEVLSVYRDADHPHVHVDPRVRVHDLVDLRPESLRAGALTGADVAALRGRPPRLIDPAADHTLDALADIGLESALPRLTAEVLVTVTPALLAAATTLAPGSVAVVHQEHRSSSQRRAGLDNLLLHARRADTVAMLSEPMSVWFRETLGDQAPRVVTMPNALPRRLRPRSPLTEPVILAAGRLAREKQYPDLVRAFALVADELPQWRLRIFGDGPARIPTMAAARRLGLWDRVELPGPTADLRWEWARASISALTSDSEGYPLVMQEAMAAGVPVVAYDCPSGPRAIIEDGVDGLLVAQDSIEAMAAALLRLAGDPEERSRLGAAALGASRRWDPDLIRDQWVEILSEAVRRHSGASVPTSGRATALHTARPSDTDPGGAVTHPPRGGAEVGAEIPDVTPAQARRAALQTVLAAVPPEAGHDWWVVPPHTGGETILVLPMTARRPFLRALAAAEAAGSVPAYLGVVDPEQHGWPGRRGTARDLLEPLLRGRTSRLLVEPWPSPGDVASPLEHGCGVTVEFWEEGPSGELHSPGPSRYATHVPRRPTLVRTQVHGIDVPTHEVMTAPEPHEVTFDVDVVCAWPTELDALRHGLRGVHLFAPWVRSIHVVTVDPPPDWLDVDHPQIRLVDRRSLPEHDLDRIEGLAEHVLRLTDGEMVARSIRPEALFTAAGLPSVAVPSTAGSDTVVLDLADHDLDAQLRRLRARHHDFLRLVATGDRPPRRAHRQRPGTVVHAFLASYFPIAAPWEHH